MSTPDCFCQSLPDFVGWGKRSAPHHPDTSDPENIKRHRRFMGGHRCAHPTLRATHSSLNVIVIRVLLGIWTKKNLIFF
jgi:hypothetical protein